MPRAPPRVPLSDYRLEERLVLLDGGEVPAFPQHQRLVHGLLQAEVGLLDIAVLVRLAGLYLVSLDLVVGKKGVVATGDPAGEEARVGRETGRQGGAQLEVAAHQGNGQVRAASRDACRADRCQDLGRYKVRESRPVGHRA